MQKRIDITDGIYILVGDSREVLKSLPEKSVQCGVTSQPYYGLRFYGTDGVIWGGDPSCEHEWETVHPPGQRSSDTHPGPLQHDGNKNREKLTSNTCKKCGAWKGELGLEPTPELYVQHLVEIFREFRRVLRDDGVLWVNIGDSYSRNPSKGGSGTPTGRNGRREDYTGAGYGGCKEKDLIGIPWLFAFAMRADGWYLRADLPWIKRNSMPSSVTDRPASSIEHVFLFSKSGKPNLWIHPEKGTVSAKPEPDYIYENNQTMEKTTSPPDNWKEMRFVSEDNNEEYPVWSRRNLWRGRDYYYDYQSVMQLSSESYNKDKRPRGVIRQKVNENTKYDRDDPQYAKVEPKQDGVGNNTYTGFNARYEPNGMGLRFMRDSDFFFRTWQGLLHNENGEPMALVVNPKGYKGAHFAAFPVKLVEPMIIAGSRPGDIVLDMFAGSCATGAACLIHGRKFIGIDVKEEYCELGKKRMEDEIARLKGLENDGNESRAKEIPEQLQGNDGPAPGRDAKASAQQPIAEEAGLASPEVQNHNGATPGETDGLPEETTKPVEKRTRKKEAEPRVDLHPARQHTRTVADRLQGLSETPVRDGSAALSRDESDRPMYEVRSEGNDKDDPWAGVEVLPTVRRGDEQT
jgi:DNA modification methylase